MDFITCTKKYGYSFHALIIFIAVLAVGSVSNIYAQTSENKPNFLVIIGDDFGYSDIGSFGSEISTPNLEALANDGKILMDYHTAPTCSPARVSLLTGVDWHIGGIGTMFELIAPNQEGQPGYETYINDNVVTVAELLKDAGYDTLMTGKWHLSGHGYEPGTAPSERGFSNTFTLLEDGSNHFSSAEYIPGYTVSFMENGTKVDRPGNGTLFSNSLYTDKLLEYLKNIESNNKPFFAYLAFQVAHSPFMAPSQELIDKYDKIYSEGWDKIRDQRFEKQKELGFWASNMTDPGRLPPNEQWDNLSDDQKAYAARVLAVHSAMIEDMDNNIGKVIQYLKDTGKYDNTFIMFTSDNASSEPFEMRLFKYASGVDLSHAEQFVAGINNSLPNLGTQTSDFNYGAWGSYVAVAPFSGFKTSFYEGGTRPPFVVKLPETSVPSSNNTTSNFITSFAYVTDITPTILELAGVSHPSTYQGHEVHPMMGKSLKPVLEGSAEITHAADEPISGELFNFTTTRMGEWKAIGDGLTGQWELFNLANDLGENTDLSAEHPELLQKMIADYEQYAQEVGVVIPRGEAFAESAQHVFPDVTPDNTQTISLADMFAPGYFSLNETKSGPYIIN